MSESLLANIATGIAGNNGVIARLGAGENAANVLDGSQSVFSSAGGGLQISAYVQDLLEVGSASVTTLTGLTGSALSIAGDYLQIESDLATYGSIQASTALTMAGDITNFVGEGLLTAAAVAGGEVLAPVAAAAVIAGVVLDTAGLLEPSISAAFQGGAAELGNFVFSDQSTGTGVSAVTVVEANGSVDTTTSPDGATVTQSWTDGATSCSTTTTYTDSTQSTISSISATSSDSSSGYATIDVFSGVSGPSCTFSQTVDLAGTSAFVRGVSGVETPDGVIQTLDIEGVGTDAAVSNASVALASGASASVVGDGNALNLANDASALVSGTLDAVSAAGASVTLTTGSSINLSGSSDGVTLQGTGDYTGILSGDGDTISGSSGTIDTLGNLSVTLDGNSNIGYLGSSATLAMDGSGNGVSTGTNDVVSVMGDNDVVSPGGGGTVVLNGTNEYVTGAGETVTLDAGSSSDFTGGGDTVDLTGTGDYGGFTGGTDYLVNASSGTIVTLAGVTATLVGSDNDGDLGSDGALAIVGSGNGINIGTNDAVAITGSSNIIDAGSGNDFVISGTGEAIAGTGETVTLDPGAGASFSGGSDTLNLAGTGDYAGIVTGSGYSILGSDATVDTLSDTAVSVTGSLDVLDLTGSSDIASITGSLETVYGTDASISVGAGSDVTFNGGGNTISSSAAGNQLGLDDTNGGFDLVDASSGNLSLAADTQANIVGGGDTVGVSSGDSTGVYGAANTVYAGVDQQIVLGNTNGAFDTVYAAGDNAQDTTANGSASGISVNADAQANIAGAGNTVFDNAGASVGVYGQANAVYAAPGALTVLGATGGEDDVVSAYGVEGGGETANDQPTGLGFDSSTQAAVDGGTDLLALQSDDVIYASGEHIDLPSDSATTIYGNDDYIYGGVGDIIDVYGQYDPSYTSDSTVDYFGSSAGDIVDGSGDAGNDWGGYGSVLGYSYRGYGLVAGTVSKGAAINVVAQYDRAHGLDAAATDAEQGFARAELAVDGKLTTKAADLSGDAFASAFIPAAWESSTVTWSFATGAGTSASPLSDSVSAQYQGVIEQAIAAWESVSGLVLRQVSDTSNSDIRIGWGMLSTAKSGVAGITALQNNDGTMEAGSIVRLEDPADDPLVAASDGGYEYAGTNVTLYQLALHEIGHALGLAENSDPNSVMYGELGASNRDVDATDVANMDVLFGLPMPGGGDSSALVNQAIAAFQSATAAVAPTAPVNAQPATLPTLAAAPL